MKQYGKELVILLLQTFMFYVFPLFAGPADVIGMVFLILLATFVLSLVMGVCSRSSVKFAYPGAAAILFLPTIVIHYNASAMVHTLWYLVVAAVGLGIGCLLRWVFLKIKR